MPATKKDIISQLQKDLLPLQGYKPPSARTRVDIGLGLIEATFPNGSFPTGAVHEFVGAGEECAAATGGFIAGLLGPLMRSTGVCLWISSSRTLFPPALIAFGVDPDRFIFVDLRRERDVLWAMEEALKCEALAAVVGEVKEISFIASRRLQLAVEQSRVTGFVLRHHSRNLNTVACITRWKITPLPGEVGEGLPGLGFPRWNVQLLKIRNGKPGIWQVEWSAGAFRFVSGIMTPMTQEQKRKTG
jgi:protein ImuA